MYGNHTSVLGVGVGVLPMTGAGNLLAPLLIGSVLLLVGSLLLVRSWMLTSQDAEQ